MPGERLHVSVPVEPDGSLCHHLSTWLARLARTDPAALGLSAIESVIVTEKPVASCRNRQCDEFLKTGFDFCLFVDDDAIPDEDGLRHLLDAIRNPDVDAVGGWSLVKGEGAPEPSLHQLNVGSRSSPHEDVLAREPGLHELVDGSIGAHCLMTKRATLVRIREEGDVWFKDRLRDASLEGFEIRELLAGDDTAMREGLGKALARNEGHPWGQRWLGQDIWFCMMVLTKGMRLWVDTRVLWGHVKPCDLRGEFCETLGLRQQLAERRRGDLAVAEELRASYGNEKWTAGPGFIEAAARAARSLPEGLACVECGSGLTTRVLRRILGDRLVSLEHDPLEAHRNGAVWAELKSFGDWSWYSVNGHLPARIGLVVCDGPPGTTPGGRYGALPGMKDRLAPGFALLLDDVNRPAEKAILDRWNREFGPFAVEITEEPDGRAFALAKQTGAGHGR